MADTTIDLLKNSSYVGKMDELIAAVKSGGGTASDVEWNNVKNKPTTIGGYGITDAKIENGTITLGDKTITPLTSAPVTSVNSQTGAVVLTANDVSAIPSTLTGTAGQVLTKTADGQEWKDVEIPSGTNDHSKLINRDAADQHPIGAITGLEAALANMPPTDAFIVTLTTNKDGTNSVDKTFAEIQAALQSNRTVYLYAQGMMTFLPLVLRSPENGVIFGYISISSMEVRSIFVVVYNDDHVEIQQKTIKKLPNPNALTFTGAVTGSYDGSAPLSVEIPSGGGGGGSSQWKIIRDLTIAENADRVDINTDDAGKTFSLHEIQVFAYTRSHADTAESFTFLMNGYWSAGDPYFSSGFKSTKSSDNYYAYNHFIAMMQNGIANVFQPWKQYIVNSSTGGDIASIGDKYQAIESVSFVGKFIAGCRFVLVGRVSS